MILQHGQYVGSGVPVGTPTPGPEEPEEQPTTPPEPEEVEQPEEVEEVSTAPKEYAPKGEWVDWAVAHGENRDQAEEFTKAELIELYGGDS